MNRIIPYNSQIRYSDGGFINNNGEVIIVNHHEVFARNYCFGKDYDFLRGLRNGRINDFEYYKKNYNFDGSKEGIDIFLSSNLTKEQLTLLKIWIEKNDGLRRGMISDFMLFVLGFDKIETIMRRAITTTSNQPHTKFYNYYLMDWHIDKKAPMKYNETTGLFEYDKPKDWIIYYNEDRKIESEINEIKANVLRKDRHHFFK